MKKTLIALAAVAVTGAAFAQSSVTLSGTLDVGFQKRWSGDATRMTGDRNGTSNWTLAGAEDLGGGLKGIFQISTSFNPDNGTNTAGDFASSLNNIGNNGMFVGLTGGFGTVQAGRPVHLLHRNTLLANGTKGVTAHDSTSVLGGVDLVSAAATQPEATQRNALQKVGGTSNAVYQSNTIQYLSPMFGGLQVQVEYAPSESLAPASQDGVAVAVRYAAGPLVVSFVNSKGANATQEVKAVNQLAAAYDFGVARALFTYRAQGKSGITTSANDTSYALGVTAPVGPGLIYASYNVNEQAGNDGKTIIAGYKYNLSKRTQAYVNIANRNAAWNGAAVSLAASGGNGTKSSNGFGFGLQHNF